MPAEGAFDLIFAAFNTLFVLPTQDAQVQCLGAVADHLAPGGAFVVSCRIRGGTAIVIGVA